MLRTLARSLEHPGRRGGRPGNCLDSLFIQIYIDRYTSMAKPPDPETFIPLKPHWFHVLLSLADREQHGYGIMQEVLERTGGKVRLWPATLYGTLKRLIDADLIS